MKLYKSNPEYAEALKVYPYVFSIRNYGYFFSREDWNAIQFTNVQPTFNPETEDLLVEEYEEDDVVKRRWVVEPKPPEPEDEVLE